MFPECSCICACVHASFEQTLLARYLKYLLMEFGQTFTKVTMGSSMPQNALFGLVVCHMLAEA